MSTSTLIVNLQWPQYQMSHLLYTEDKADVQIDLVSRKKVFSACSG